MDLVQILASVVIEAPDDQEGAFIRSPELGLAGVTDRLGKTLQRLPRPGREREGLHGKQVPAASDLLNIILIRHLGGGGLRG